MGLEACRREVSLIGLEWGPDPDQSMLFQSESPLNVMHYHNDRYDELAILQDRELDAEKRIAMIVEQTNIVNDEAAAGILVFGQRIAGSAPRLHNFFPNGFGGQVWSVPYVWAEA